MTKEFYATLAERGKAETGQTQDLQVLALTNPELEPALDEAMGAPVLWLTQNIFYASVEPVCVVFKTMYQQMAEADQSELTLRLQDPLSPEAGAVEVKLTEAGLHGGDTSTVYLPWGYAQRLMEERFQSISYDSLQFYVKDNRQLQALHDWVQRLFQPVDIQGGDTLYSYALTIYDQTYWSTLATLQQNIRRSQYTIPILLVLVILAGALISFLAVRSARRSGADTLPTSPAGSSSEWPSPGRWPSDVRSFWPMSRPGTWTRRIPGASRTCCCAWHMRRDGASLW